MSDEKWDEFRYLSSLRMKIAASVAEYQQHQNCASGQFPYPGGVIAFGKREDVLSMLGHQLMDVDQRGDEG